MGRMSEMHPSLVELDRAAKSVGSRVILADLIGVPRSTLQSRIDNNKPVPAEWCPRIEKATKGEVRRHQLRPDLWPAVEGNAA